MDERYQQPKIEDIEIEDQEEEIIEKRYVLANRWKRIGAFLIDFVAFIAIIYVLNSFVTKPYLYQFIFNMNATTEEYDQKIVDLAQSKLDVYPGIIDENGVWCTPEYEGYVCNEAYGDFVVGDKLTYANFVALGILDENRDKWDVDPCYENRCKFLASSELKKLYNDYVTISTRYDRVTQLADSMIALFLIYILPVIFFKNGRTFGKKIFGLLVVDHVGRPIQNFMYLFRTFIGFWAIEYVSSVFLSFIPILVSAIFTFISKKQKSIHDLIFGTYVVSEQMEDRVIIYEKPVEPIEEEGQVDEDEYY